MLENLDFKKSLLTLSHGSSLVFIYSTGRLRGSHLKLILPTLLRTLHFRLLPQILNARDLDQAILLLLVHRANTKN